MSYKIRLAGALLSVAALAGACGPNKTDDNAAKTTDTTTAAARTTTTAADNAASDACGVFTPADVTRLTGLPFQTATETPATTPSNDPKIGPSDRCTWKGPDAKPYVAVTVATIHDPAGYIGPFKLAISGFKPWEIPGLGDYAVSFESPANPLTAVVVIIKGSKQVTGSCTIDPSHGTYRSLAENCAQPLAVEALAKVA